MPFNLGTVDSLSCAAAHPMQTNETVELANPAQRVDRGEQRLSVSPPDAARRLASRRIRNLKRIGWNLLPPLTFVAIVGVWAAAIPIFKIPAYLLPSPGGVFARLITDFQQLWDNSLVTLTRRACASRLGRAFIF